MIQALRRVNISVLQIQGLQLRIRIIYALSDITAHQRILRHPIQTIRQRERVGFQGIQNLTPQIKNLRGRSIHTRRVRLLMRAGGLIVGALNLQGARRTARGHRIRQGRRRRRQRQLNRQRQIVADRVHRRHRIRQAHTRQYRSLLAVRLNQVHHQRRRAKLQQVRIVREVRVRRNHVQAAVLRLIRMRLITRIHNRAANRGLQTNRALKEISTRTNLKTRNLTVRTNTHTARTRKNRAGRKERQERIRNLLERNITADQVVFVGAVRLALRIGVVLVQLHLRQILPVVAQLHQRLVRQRVTGSVIEHRIGGGQNLRRGILRMRVIHIQARTIGQNRVHGHAVPVQTLRETTAAVHTGERIQGATRLGGFTRCLNPRLTHNLQGDIFAGQLGAGVRHLA